MSLKIAHENMIQGIGRIAYFWGFPKSLGATYGEIYLTKEPLTLDDIVEKVAISKGAASTNVRHLERLKMIRFSSKPGDRKNYYTAETDFWKIVKNILKERHQGEFDQALNTVGESLEIVKSTTDESSSPEEIEFYKDRISKMESFFKTLDTLVSLVVKLEDFKTKTITKIFTSLKGKK